MHFILFLMSVEVDYIRTVINNILLKVVHRDGTTCDECDPVTVYNFW